MREQTVSADHTEAKCPQCGSLSPEKCNKPCTDKSCGAYRQVDDIGYDYDIDGGTDFV